MSLHLSKCHIVGNHMWWLNCGIAVVCTVSLPQDAMGRSMICDCGIS